MFERWDQAQAAAFLAANLVPAPIGGDQGGAPPGGSSGGSGGGASSGGGSSEPFALLGFDQGYFYYQPRAAGQVVKLARASHTSTNLVSIAPLSYWEQFFPAVRQGVDWTAAASNLMARQYLIGCFDPDRIRGRGAWVDNGKTVLHLGDRLVINRETIDVLDPPSSRFIYQRARRKSGPGDAIPLTADEGLGILMLANRFSWETPSSGYLLAGWSVLAPICGAIQWRPHVWLTGVAGSGKSQILSKYVYPLLGDLLLKQQSSSTEAGVRQSLNSDAFPVILDELESNTKKGQSRVEDILELARMSSTEGNGTITKGSAAGTAVDYEVRSMFMISSINTAIKQASDASRFAILALKKPSKAEQEQAAAHWKKLSGDLFDLISEETGRKLIARTLNLLPVLLEAIEVFRAVGARLFQAQRDGDQYGTLMAGAWILANDHCPTREEAEAMFGSTEWVALAKNDDETEQFECLRTILEYQMTVETGERRITRTVAELIDIAAGGLIGGDISSTIATEHLGRNGMKWDRETGGLLVSNKAKGIGKILAGTQWAANAWPAMLASLPGAERCAAVRFKSLPSVQRAVLVPAELVR